MKNYLPLFLIGLLAFILSSCGTTASLSDTETYVPYAKVQLDSTLQVTGRLVNLNDSIIALSVEGAYVEYRTSDVIFYDTYLAPDPVLMQRDVVRNTKDTAGNTGFLVTVTIISIFLAVVVGVTAG